jgi:uncharacterized membrane protein YeaQ/YmgE (transglycosylase-associated protein family)
MMLASPVTLRVGVRLLGVCAPAGTPAAAAIDNAASAATMRCFMPLQRVPDTKRAAVSGRIFAGRWSCRNGATAANLHKRESAIMGLIGWLIVGLIAGVLAKWAVPGEGPGGILGDIIIGIIGAFIGGWVFNFFGHAGVTGLNIGSIIVAFIGAVILLYIIRAFSGRRSVV